MELVEQNRGLRRMRIGRQAERFPHVHDGEANARALPLAEPGVEPAHARLRAVLAAEPDRPAAHQVADHDAVGVTLADRNLVDPDHLWTGRPRARQLSPHVLHLQRLDRVPIQRQFLRHVLDRRLPAAPADKIGKALGVERIVRLDAAAAPARRFFERRLSVITRAFGSPKMPRTVGCGRKPGNEYPSHSRRLRFAGRAIRN